MTFVHGLQIHKLFHKIEEDIVPNIKLNLKLFLVTVEGNYLAYTSIFPVEIRITCINNKNPGLEFDWERFASYN